MKWANISNGPWVWNNEQAISISGIRDVFPRSSILIGYFLSSISKSPIKDTNHNFCRNPEGDSKGPWCYTTDPTVKWDYCHIPDCDTCEILNSAGSQCIPPGKGLYKMNKSFLGILMISRKGYDGTRYKGTINITKSGHACQNWLKKSPHEPNQNKVQGLIDENKDHNYCRNPDNDKEGPWCYTTAPNLRWEHCEIPECRSCDEPCGENFAPIEMTFPHLPVRVI